MLLFWKMLRRRSITRKAGIASKLKVSLAGVSMNADCPEQEKKCIEMDPELNKLKIERNAFRHELIAEYH
jgi:hypothetical protein